MFFPKASFFCRNPACDGEEFEETKLSRRGTSGRFTDAQYQPPPPYIPTHRQLHAVRASRRSSCADEQMVVLGQVADGFTVADLEVGQQVELVIEELFSDDDNELPRLQVEADRSET